MMLIVSSLIFISILFLFSKKIENIVLKKGFKFAIIVSLIAIALEFSLFNFRAYESLFFGEEINTNNYTLGEGLVEDENGYIKVLEEKYNYIDVTNINAHLDNIYINFEASENSTKSVYATIGFTDSANKYNTYGQERRINANINNKGEILRYHTAGKSKRIRIYINTVEKKDSFKINNISFNKRVPFNISLLRPILILCFSLLIYIFRPKSQIYKLNLFEKKNKKLLILTVVLEIIFLGIVAQFNRYFVNENFRTPQRMQYQLLAEAFVKGQTYLDIDPHPVLKNLHNPYDKKAREMAFRELYKEIDITKKPDDYYIWDAAFFNDRYYVYFGVAPVITYYLPFYLATGHHIKTVTCLFITAIITVIGIFLLLYDMTKKWFKNVKLGSFIAFYLIFVNSCGILAMMGRPDHYSLPILMGIMFSIYGLLFWLKAIDKDLKASYLFLGSLCMASVAACRPQLLLTSFFALPLFWNKVFKERKLFSKDSIKKTFMWVLPYLVIGILLMMYNYVRFGSPLDFGANYNLTTNDMTKRGFVIGRIPLGIFYYLFNPLNLSLKFPFVIREYVATNYLGRTIYEDMSAGFLVANLLCLFGVFIYKFKKDIKSKDLYNIGFWSIIFSLIIIVADTEMAGILPRYICDFAFLIYLATAIVLFTLLSKENHLETLNKLIFIAFVFALFYNFFLLFSDDILYNLPFCYYVRSLLEFWI